MLGRRRGGAIRLTQGKYRGEMQPVGAGIRRPASGRREEPFGFCRGFAGAALHHGRDQLIVSAHASRTPGVTAAPRPTPAAASHTHRCIMRVARVDGGPRHCGYTC